MIEDPAVVIVGGGPIGLACALLQARRGIHCRVIETRPLEQSRGDPRLLALSAGTWQLLEPLLGEQTLRRAPIREVYVSSAGEFGGAHLSSQDFDGADLGATVRYGDLLGALDGAARAEARIVLDRPRRVLGLSQSPASVEVELDNGEALTAAYVVVAEGGALAGVEEVGAAAGAQKKSQQDAEAFAVLANVQMQRPRHARAAAAYERFTREGPLALLPTPERMASDMDTFALVWCCDRPNAERRSQIDDRSFVAELNAAVGPRIGCVLEAAPRQRVALQQSLRRQLVAHRVVALGNAAQSLHPVAGQGFNLGLRDCATLAACLENETELLPALERYARSRQVDRQVIATLTRWLPELFATSFLPVALARSAALAALGITAAARRDLAHVLMFGVRA